MKHDISQQDFLRQAMKALDMTREEFADLVGTQPRALNNWLLPEGSKGYRSMPEMAWKFIQLLLDNHHKNH